MSWLFSQALVVEYLGDTFLDGEPSVQLSGNNTQLAYLQPDKMTDFSRLSRFGMMFKPLTESLGEELLMSYRAAFHAKTSPQQVKEQGLTESGQECGKKWQGSFARYDLSSCLWKTAQCSLLEDLEQSLQTWPKWGSMRNGECLVTTNLVDNIGVNEFGLLPTPTKNLFSHWESAKAKVFNGGKRKSGVKVGSILWWEMTEQHLRLGGVEDKSMIPDPSCGEIVMGWPMGWTELQSLETDKYHKWQQQHGTSLKED
jgi:hypothetical protein